ncbi:MAG TPA: DEAD/DEAH box helicase [Phototrophicaceae bacterium]|nr:DEAD/DEAH box helicase [Phototrophicaceae bacterium]
MPILHGTFDPGSRRFLLWGESDTLRVKKQGRQPKTPLHPFALSGEKLTQWAASLLPHLLSEPLSRSVWLPSSEQQPQASPELQATGVFVAGDTASPYLRSWQVEALALPIPNTLSLLLALPHRSDIGRDLRFWRAAALEALALVGGQQVMPALDRDGFHLRAFWQVVPVHPERLTDLAAQMPAVCRALTETPESAVSPYQLLDSFVQAAVDSTVREAAQSVSFPRGRSAGAAWWTALTGIDPQLKLPSADAEALFKAWQSWAGQNDAAGNTTFRIAFRLDAPEDTSDDEIWTLNYLLQATDDPSLIVHAGQIWRGQGDPYLVQRFDQPQERLLRGLAFAGRLFAPILGSLRAAAPQNVTFDSAQAYSFLKEAAPLLQASGFRVLLPHWWGGQSARLSARAKISSKPTGKARLTLDTLLNYEMELMLGGQVIDRAEFFRLAALKQPLVRLRGQWVLLDSAQIEAGLKFFEQGSRSLNLEEALRLGLDGDEAAGLPIDNVHTNGWLKTLLDSLQQLERIALLAAPDGLRAQLRPYQQRGYSWMAFLRRYGLGACLADDMGLGKTLETIALLLNTRAEAQHPTLVVCPTSVVGNWRHELNRFAPELSVLTHQGVERAAGAAFEAILAGIDVVLTSYPLLARDRETLEAVAWSTVILDEAQNIKNSATKQAQAARALRADQRIALTGTPVENRLSELWSIFQFLNPDYLGSEKSFRRRFAIPIEKLDDADAAKHLKRLTAPFILRRLKTDPAVISDLPDKLEMKVYTTLTTEQGTLYEAVVKEVIERIEGAEAEGDEMSRRGLVLSLLMQLKQICNHPAQYLKDGSPLEGRSGKLARLTEMLEEVYSVGDRALVFTQFAEMGEMLRAHLRDIFYDEPLWLHGGTKVKEREDMIRRFQAEHGPTVFILSLKAGGVGLNLTRANHVFHYDRWWNPAVENQATDRAFRIGQTRNVQVHKFVCAGTLEEKIDAMIESKKALAERIVGADESWLTELNTADLRDLVRLREVGD